MKSKLEVQFKKGLKAENKNNQTKVSFFSDLQSTNFLFCPFQVGKHAERSTTTKTIINTDNVILFDFLEIRKYVNV